MASNTTNVAPIISNDVLNTISTSTAIKTFGNQTKDPNKQTTIIGDQTVGSNLQARKDELDEREKQAGEEKSRTIEKANKDYQSKQITLEQRNEIEFNANASYDIEIDAIKLTREKINQDEQNLKNNPDDKIKENQKKKDEEIKKSKNDIAKKDTTSKRDLTKQVLSNAKKNIAPIIALQLSNAFLVLLSERKKLETLVNQVNDYINTQVKDQNTVVIATNLRNNAVALINNNIKKLNTISNIIKTINTVLRVFILILAVASLFPFPVPPKIVKTIVSATAVISSISVILSIATSLIATEIEKLIELRNRLAQISLKLEEKALESLTKGDQTLAAGAISGSLAGGAGAGTGVGAVGAGGAGGTGGAGPFNLSGAGSNITNNSIDQQLSNLSNAFLPLGGDFPPYKGFIFKIKEENNPKFVVRGNKRRYAAAIDKYGVEILKSEFSFTLDPNDLVEQLKLVIDQQNLQG